jgi:hypothetical protein
MNKIKRFIGEMICFFYHQWFYWEPSKKAYEPDTCSKCGRRWEY